MGACGSGDKEIGLQNRNKEVENEINKSNKERVRFTCRLFCSTT
jgi:hypothetical protein